MRFVRAIAQADGLRELQTYDCKECGVAMPEAQDSQFASTAASDRAPIIGALLMVFWSALLSLNPFRIGPPRHSVEPAQVLRWSPASLGLRMPAVTQTEGIEKSLMSSIGIMGNKGGNLKREMEAPTAAVQSG